MIRAYKDSDYDQLIELYRHSEWYGGQLDEARDSKEKLANLIAKDPEAILVYEDDRRITGTVSLIENGRVAWLFRFAVKDNDVNVSKGLYAKAAEILGSRGHSQVLVYSASGDEPLNSRYQNLGMNKGGDYTAFWSNI